MKQLIIQTKNVALIFVSFLALNSCKVTFVPSYDSKISEQIDETSKSVDLFYLNMLETTSDKDTSREFAK
jgi:translation initiation factor 2 beta subunit (eIF-2beta)/eIF-5